VAVYTHVSEGALRALLAEFEIGGLVDFAGIAEGVENTNYVVRTDSGKFILTLFERRVREADLPFFIALMEHLSAKGVAAPRPIRDREGKLLKSVCGRPAVLTSFLPGKMRAAPTVDECRAFGAVLAGLHRAVADFKMARDNALGLAGWKRLASLCGDDAERCAPGLGALIEDELAFLSAHWPRDLPCGVVHADLFIDNVFFDGADVSGVIDFYFACTDYFAFDLAICVNAWSSVGGAWRNDNGEALLEGYARVRPLSGSERAALPVLRRGAALRFLLTRLYDWINQVEGALVTVKDPLEYRDILLRCRRP
jgi:homoserine kinase type II